MSAKSSLLGIYLKGRKASSPSTLLRTSPQRKSWILQTQLCESPSKESYLNIGSVERRDGLRKARKNLLCGFHQRRRQERKIAIGAMPHALAVVPYGCPALVAVKILLLVAELQKPVVLASGAPVVPGSHEQGQRQLTADGTVAFAETIDDFAEANALFSQQRYPLVEQSLFHDLPPCVKKT